MTTIAEEVRELRNAVADSQMRTVELIEFWVAGFDAGVPQATIVAAMKQAAHDLRQAALKP